LKFEQADRPLNVSWDASLYSMQKWMQKTWLAEVHSGNWFVFHETVWGRI
jgi:hypothetical protein